MTMSKRDEQWRDGSHGVQVVWQKLGAALDDVGAAGVAMWHLQRVLAKKRDPLTHVRFEEVLLSAGATLPIPRFWRALIY
jgi:hypothetical protein